MEIYSCATDFMHGNGNPSQWTGGYPSWEHVWNDMTDGHCFVAAADDGAIQGVFSLIPSPEPTYSTIYGGSWIDDSPYRVIHRIAVAKRGAGIASYCMEWCIRCVNHLRADTHRDNVPMQRLLIKYGFEPRGTVLLADGSERIAFERLGASICNS